MARQTQDQYPEATVDLVVRRWWHALMTDTLINANGFSHYHWARSPLSPSVRRGRDQWV